MIQSQTSELDGWAKWLLSRRYGGSADVRESMSRWLEPIRSKILDNAELVPGDTVLDVGCGDGFLAFGALARVGVLGTTIFGDVSEDLLELCKNAAESMGAALVVSSSQLRQRT